MNKQKIKTVAMLGLGTMGHGIAQVFAAAGYQVRGYDHVAGARDSLRDRCRANLEEMAAAGMLERKSI